MPFTLIQGTLRVRGKRPDGDSIGFIANNQQLWGSFKMAQRVKVNKQGVAQLRLEAIDTLETHYTPTGGHVETHQPFALANAATDFLLSSLGFKHVRWDANHSTVLDAEDNLPAYILTRGPDQYGRPVSFLFPGKSPEQDGAPVILHADRLTHCANYMLAAKGMAYPTYYQGLFYDLRATITQAVHAARAAKLGIWQQDRTNSGFEATDIKEPQEAYAILPKLFRRVVSYLADGGAMDAGFIDYLAATPDPLYNIETGHYTNFDTYIEVTGHTAKLTVAPESLLFVPK